ncbi:hypothetical protein AX15_007174 [Amanita polypyramis BW_CC]|nr:hypothetical protein AX15_007174 [Amanita polypyramis BW_CC]
MPPLPSRKVLESMRRVDLQKLCKDYGVKANLKSEALIDLLLDTQAAATSKYHPNASNPQAEPQPSRRSVSTRPPSQAGPSRTSSMIIHEMDDGDDESYKAKHEETDKQMEEIESDRPKPSIPGTSRPLPSMTVSALTRSRKAQESQRRLGVGKPVVAGGAGPRTVTRSTTLSRGKRIKPSKAIKPEATILEEEAVPGSSLQPVLQGKYDDVMTLTSSLKTKVSSGSLATLADVDEVVASALRPLHEQLQALRVELEQMHLFKAELVQLRGEVEGLKPLNTLLNPTTPKSKDPLLKKPLGPDGLGMPPSVRSPNFQESSSQSSLHDTLQPQTLGKRPREPSEKNMQGNGPGDEGGSVEKQDDLHVSKKPKILQHDDRIEPARNVHPSGSRGPTFSVFQEPNDPPEGANERANMTHLSDYLTIPSPPGTVSAPEFARHDVPLENQNPFTFTFAPGTSTPAPQVIPHCQALYSMSSLPFLEPPQSPSPNPATGRNVENDPGDEKQMDIYQSFGLPPPGRPTARIPSTVNPMALTTGKEADVPITSNDVVAGLGLHTISSSITSMQPESEDAPPMRITMYGTELDGDTRFGDFGVEGVATGFWTGGRF